MDLKVKITLQGKKILTDERHKGLCRLNPLEQIFPLCLICNYATVKPSIWLLLFSPIDVPFFQTGSSSAPNYKKVNKLFFLSTQTVVSL